MQWILGSISGVEFILFVSPKGASPPQKHHKLGASTGGAGVAAVGCRGLQIPPLRAVARCKSSDYWVLDHKLLSFS